MRGFGRLLKKQPTAPASPSVLSAEEALMCDADARYPNNTSSYSWITPESSTPAVFSESSDSLVGSESTPPAPPPTPRLTPEQTVAGVSPNELSPLTLNAPSFFRSETSSLVSENLEVASLAHSPGSAQTFGPLTPLSVLGAGWDRDSWFENSSHDGDIEQPQDYFVKRPWAAELDLIAATRTADSSLAINHAKAAIAKPSALGIVAQTGFGPQCAAD